MTRTNGRKITRSKPRKPTDRDRARFSEALAALRFRRDRVFDVSWDEHTKHGAMPHQERVLAAGHGDACGLATGLATFAARWEGGLRVASFAPVDSGVVCRRIWVREVYGDEIAPGIVVDNDQPHRIRQ